MNESLFHSLIMRKDYEVPVFSQVAFLSGSFAFITMCFACQLKHSLAAESLPRFLENVNVATSQN